MDKISYALGLSIANNFKATGIRELNVEDFTAAVAAVFEGGEPALSYDEAKEIMNEYFTNLQKFQLEQNKVMGEEFLAENKKNPNVVTLPSGLQYEILKEGEGKQPSATDQVKCHYTGALIDGTVFDSSEQRGEPATFGVNQVIPGWVEALQLMKEGSRWRLFIPSQLAYGERGAGQAIMPFSTLVFEVELLEVL
ncbi:MAG: FKBP-type peptidyl-prolyl cis-trans isomerase [Bacteroidales bacterium]